MLDADAFDQLVDLAQQVLAAFFVINECVVGESDRATLFEVLNFVDFTVLHL